MQSLNNNNYFAALTIISGIEINIWQMVFLTVNHKVKANICDANDCDIGSSFRHETETPWDSKMFSRSAYSR